MHDGQQTPAQPITATLSATQAAKMLGVHRKTVAKWRDSGHLPVWFYDDNGRAIYSIAVIEAHQRRIGELAAERAAA